jgi:predicted site-specific integrase-resolvase
MTVTHMNQRQLANRWCVSEATLERWRSEGIGPQYLKLGGRVMYREQDIEVYALTCLRRSTSQPLNCS